MVPGLQTAEIVGNAAIFVSFPCRKYLIYTLRNRLGRFSVRAIMKKLLVAGIAAAAFCSAPALAADMPVKAPPPAPPVAAPSWTGFYIGGNVGWGWTDPSTVELDAIERGFSPSNFFLPGQIPGSSNSS